MIYIHKRTNKVYRKLFESFSVERQTPSVVYMQVDSGCVFDRDADSFYNSFQEFEDPQSKIVPREIRK